MPSPAQDTAHPARPVRVVPILITAATVGLAALLAWAMWAAYVEAPWTRDGAVRAYVVTETPEVSGRIVSLAAHADQYVHKGDLLLEIDPTDFSIAVSNAEAALAQAKADVENRKIEAARRLKLTTLSTSVEEQQTYVTQAQIADAVYSQDLAILAQARVNLKRTQIISRVNGYVTNLSVQVGDYATTGQHVMTIVNTDSFWVDGYFEETQLKAIHVGDPARISLMGHRELLHGHVAGIARGIDVLNAQSDPAGLAMVNPVFTWIRLAQRVPVRIELDQVSA
ncbi:MAG: HlyD family secretion protein [Acetobacteraceae bacterium]